MNPLPCCYRERSAFESLFWHSIQIIEAVLRAERANWFASNLLLAPYFNGNPSESFVLCFHVFDMLPWGCLTRFEIRESEDQPFPVSTLSRIDMGQRVSLPCALVVPLFQQAYFTAKFTIKE